ncbi:MAG: RluA family pseudouridine synthase, partial [Lachnospiraceae bacterium]|nr:RluA family pseudouridine synthase [Lachnospiraceae bacterium]
MLKVLYEDQEIIVVVKPAGVESQAAKKFAPDMLSEIKKHMVINKLCTPGKEPYVAVIHRLDKPVSGVMVYAKTKKAASALSEQVQNRKMDKYYEAVVCGKPVNNVDNFVDYLKKSVDGNYSQIVDKGENESKRAELSYELLKTVETENGELSHVRIHLLTGRHHQI